MDEFSGALQVLSKIKTNSDIVCAAKKTLVLYGVMQEKCNLDLTFTETGSCQENVEDAVKEKKPRLSPPSSS